MDISTLHPDFATLPAPSYQVLTTVTDQISAVNTLIGLARQRIRVFDTDLSTHGWNAPLRAELLGSVLRLPDAHLDIIVHDTRYLEASCPRVTALLRYASDAIAIRRTGPEAHAATDALVIIDDCHFLHRFHSDGPRAALGLVQAGMAKPLIARFEEIWATGEPGVNATVLGL